MRTESLGDMLLREGLITHSQLEEAVVRQQASEKSIGQMLVEMGVISESVKMSFLKKKLGYDFFSLGGKKIPPLILTYIPKAFALKYHLLPVNLDNGVLIVAMDDPSDLTIQDQLKALVGMPVRPVIASISDIDEGLKQYPETTEEEEPEIERPPSLIYRAIKYCAFPILGFLPLVGFILLVRYHPNFDLYLTEVMSAGSSFSFDVFLYTLLGWGLWIIVMWEVNGLIFDKKPRQISASKPDEESPE